MKNLSYRIAFAGAVILHIGVAVLLMNDPSSKQPILMLASTNEVIEPKNMEEKPQEQAIKAVSVDNNELMQAVNQLKENRKQQQQAEEKKQQKLLQQADAARKERIAEQQQLQKLKNEAAKLAHAREKQIKEEQQHMKQLAMQKAEEEKRIDNMKKQQKEEAKKLAELKKKKDEMLAIEAKANLEKANAEAEIKRQATIAKAAADSERNARIAGEVDKYKALIVNAISRQWILPDNADRTMSSQFRIRLAPNGAVLDVNLTRSSGDAILDRSAQSAIYKASPLPVPNDSTMFEMFRDISLTVRPENARG